MPLSLNNVFPDPRVEPACWIELRQGQFVGQVNLIECDIPEELVVAHQRSARLINPKAAKAATPTVL